MYDWDTHLQRYIGSQAGPRPAVVPRKAIPMRCRPTRLALCLAVCLPAATDAQDGTVALYFASDQTCPCTFILARSAATLYVYAHLSGLSQNGITGVEYKLRVGPDNLRDVPELQFSESFAPSAVVLGSAVAPADPESRGVAVSWPQCQGNGQQSVLIETIHIVNPHAIPVPQTELQIVRSDRLNPFECPAFTLCDELRTKVCVDGESAIVNPIGSTVRLFCHLYSCPDVGVANASWSAVKALYRDASP
jgi:hypothetical protein